MTLYINGEIKPLEKITLTNLSSSTITYGTTIQLQATYILRDGGVNGQTVTLYDGNTIKTTGTTDSNGEVTFNVSNLSVGSHSLKVVCNNMESAVVSVVVNKITPTISLTGTNISYGQTLSVTGTLSVGSGKSVKIYNGNTLVDTVTTGSNGAFSKSVPNLNVGSYTFKAVYEGDATTNSVTSANVNITVSKANTNLAIDVPLNLTYSDAFNITGTLTDSNSNAISNATVKLKVGNTVVDTQTTNNNGVATFTQTPVTRGTHTFQLVYEATTNYNSSTSSTVTREINKETTVLTITSPTNNAEFNTSDTIPITGTLTTDDNETFTASIEVSDSDGNLIKTIQVNNGEINDSITAPSTSGNFSLSCTYVSTNLYTSSTVNRTVVIKEPSLSLTTDKSILSTHNLDSALLTATYDGANVNGQSVVFKQGDTVLDTVTTNVNGIATYTYASQGIGDTTITAECNGLTEEVEIEDCIYYNTATNTNSTRSSHKLYDSTLSVQLPSTVEISFDIHTPSVSNYDYRYWLMSKSQFTGNTNYPTNGLFIDKKDTSIIYAVRTNGSMSPYITGSVATNYTYATVKYVISGTEVSLYSDDTLVDTRTISWITDYSDYTISMMKWSGSQTMYMKNVKIKPIPIQKVDKQDESELEEP